MYSLLVTWNQDTYFNNYYFNGKDNGTNCNVIKHRGEYVILGLLRKECGLGSYITKICSCSKDMLKLVWLLIIVRVNNMVYLFKTNNNKPRMIKENWCDSSK